MIRAGSMSMASLRNFAASAVRRGRVASSSSARSLATVPQYATVDPDELSAASPCEIFNFVEGNWTKTKETETIVDPLNGEPFIKSPLTSVDELEPFVRAARSMPKERSSQSAQKSGEVSNVR